ncbi:MAG: type I DNA topoisomerase [Candidatus Nomurabacteria bacterium]|jgi:DNA topoisomerase-1|nr:type I DNA topoisomerase [Candidatus Nomurabacteria bacterium]
MSKNLLIVESPAKAKTIAKYLGGDFEVKSSVGHVREIPKSDRQAIDIAGGFEAKYEVSPDKKKVVSALKTAAKGKDVWLATDPDREGEAIAWHLQQVLKLPKDVKRVTYHEITKSAVEQAIATPRAIDMDLVAAGQARQVLDRIVGYELSPVVWRKVPGGKSAGRVQSPALRLVVEREREIDNFQAEEKFKVSGQFVGDSQEFEAKLNHDFDNESAAKNFLESLNGAKYIIYDINTSKGQRNPPPPFTTSTLQQECNAKMGWSAKTTMSAAQKLYQSGKITYMRTDSTTLSKQALGVIGGFIEGKFGKKYLKIRQFKTKSTSAQEAHEAIRPTNIALEAAGAGDYEKRLYDLIRRRTLASQMSPAEIDKTVIAIDIIDRAGKSAQPTLFEAKGEVITFDGFLKVYGRQSENQLPKLAVGNELSALSIRALQTFSKPPARYTEGSLVKKLESLGIGRPSTYATILDNIQARGYARKGVSDGEEVKLIELVLAESSDISFSDNTKLRLSLSDKPRYDGREECAREVNIGDSAGITRNIITEKTGADKGKLIPTDIGKVLSDFLVKYFDHVMDYDWTARIETRLDQIAGGELDKVEMLSSFYKPFHAEIDKSGDLERSQVAGARLLGVEPKSGRNIYARIARFGAVLQLGESGKDTEQKPEFIPLDKKFSIETISLQQALEQIAAPRLPRAVGTTKSGIEIVAAKGPFGNYLKCGDVNVTLPKSADPFKITLSEAEELYQAKLDSIIADWGEIKIIKGKYGPYIKGSGRFNTARIPKDQDPTKITETEARQMLTTKPAAKSKPKTKRRKKS